VTLRQKRLLRDTCVCICVFVSTGPPFPPSCYTWYRLLISSHSQQEDEEYRETSGRRRVLSSKLTRERILLQHHPMSRGRFVNNFSRNYFHTSLDVCYESATCCVKLEKVFAVPWIPNFEVTSKQRRWIT